jgi:hypothetical protein
MTTQASKVRRIRSDDIFFPAMSLVILGIVFYGFAQSYFLAGMMRAKLPNLLVHIHGALFVSWIALLIVQNLLVAGHKIRWHMTLGVLGFLLPPLMVVFGVLTLFDSIRRIGTDLSPELLLAGDLEQLALFAGLITWAMVVRRSSAAHKRLMLLGTMAILGPAINRWPFPDAVRLPATIVLYLGLPLLVVAYDIWSVRRVYRATAIATSLIIVVALTLIPVTSLPIWRPFIAWIRRS